MQPLASAIVCDEVRFEVTGKPFIIGVYPHDMVFQSLPATVPQLTIIATLFSDIKKPIRKFTVYADWPGGEFSQDFELPELPSPAFPDATRFEATVATVIRPVQVKEPGILTVKIKYEGGEVRARRVRLIVQSPTPKSESESKAAA